MEDKLTVGNPVVVLGSAPHEQFSPAGFRGCIKLSDARAGLCVQLCVSRIYSPCFWYKEAQLKKDDEFTAGMCATWDMIEKSLGYRAKVILNDSIMNRGLLRSWMFHMVRVPPGHTLENIIKAMSFGQVYQIWCDRSGIMFEEWVKRYDSRPKRPRMTESQSVLGEPLSVRRTRIS